MGQESKEKMWLIIEMVCGSVGLSETGLLTTFQVSISGLPSHRLRNKDLAVRRREEIHTKMLISRAALLLKPAVINRSSQSLTAREPAAREGGRGGSVT